MKYNFSEKIIIGLMFLVMILVEVSLFAFVWFDYYSTRIHEAFYFWGNIFIVAIYFAVYLIFSFTYNSFDYKFNKFSDIYLSNTLSLVFTNFLISLIICLLSRRFINILPMIALLVIQLLLSYLILKFILYVAHNTEKPQNTAILYDSRVGFENLINKYGLEKQFKVSIVENVNNAISNISILDRIDVVFFSGVHSSDRNVVLKYCVENDMEAYIIPRIGDTILRGAKIINLFHLPMFRVGRFHPSLYYIIIKRLFDIVVSVVMLIITLPIFLIVSICIKLEDNGPIIYSQNRLTYNGRVFKIYKFRSMKVGAEKDGVAVLSTGDRDDRITKVGRIIRRIRIDELPQFYNILMGDLSVVGPRPERPEIANEYTKKMPEFSLRLQTKAGLTGLAQVYGKYNTEPYDKLQLDLMYISNPSIIEDLRICFATVKILFLHESTEGVESNETL